MKISTTPLVVILTLVSLGFLAEAQAISPPPDGGYPGGNTAEGDNALLSLSSGFYNTAVGLDSLLSITDGNFCTGVGAGTLLVNTGQENTATGAGALLNNTTGTQNTANGTFALFNNTTGSQSTAIGFEALFNNTSIGGNSGAFNTAVGDQALSITHWAHSTSPSVARHSLPTTPAAATPLSAVARSMTLLAATTLPWGFKPGSWQRRVTITFISVRECPASLARAMPATPPAFSGRRLIPPPPL